MHRRRDMRRTLLAILFSLASLPFAAHATGPPVSPNSARQINRDRRYGHNSQGDVILGPSTIDEVVEGQRDAAGNIHVDPLTHGRPVRPPPVVVPPANAPPPTR